MADLALALRLADAADVGLLLVDDDDVIREANPTAQRLLHRRTALPGRTLLELFLDHRVSEMVAVARNAGSAHGEITAGGEPKRTLLLHATRDAGDEGTWIVVRDVSELRRLRRIRTEFIDNLSHELRTPLTNVRLLAETLAMEIEGTDVPAAIRQSVARIDSETEHLAEIVTEMLDLARIEQGEALLHRDAVDVGGVVASVVERLQPFASRQSVKLSSQVAASAEDRTVRGDPERVEQLLLNLVQNALKFAAGGNVVVSAFADPNDAELILLAVSDDGPGIAKRDLERIFERFYKVDRARSRAGASGTGLGLAIARHIAEAHGGRIWAESVEGEGARFFVALPRA